MNNDKEILERSGNRGKVIVFSAPSGAGKTTLLDYLREQILQVQYSISATTRKPRRGEVDGIHYFFLSEEEFKKRIKDELFAEWQLVHGNYYGTPRSYIEKSVQSGSHIVMDIDVYGKKKFDRMYPDATGILIVPPSMELLESRLRGRASDAEEVIVERLNNAKTELSFATSEGKYEYTIVNDNLDRAKQEALQLVSRLVKV